MTRAHGATVAVVEAQHSTAGLLPVPGFRDLGFDVAFVSNDPDRYADLANWPAITDTTTLVRGDTNSVTGILDAVKPWHDKGNLRAVYTHCDYNLPLVAAAARELGLPGLDPVAARAARNKLVTRQRCEAAGVPCPRFVHATTAADALAAARDLGLPCVVKPMTESASTGVRLCHTEAEVAAQFAWISGEPHDARGQRRPPGALVEEYALGYEVSVESVSFGGQVTVLGVTDKHLAAHPYFVEIGDTFPSLLPERITKQLADTAVAALAAIGHDFGAAHTEIRMTADGPRLIEVNARIGGEGIPDLVAAALGVDLREAVLRMHLGEPADLTPTRQAGAADRFFTAPRDGVLARVHGLDVAARMAGVTEVEVRVAPGDAVHAAVSDHQLCGHVFAVADTPAEAARRVEAAAGQISFEVSPA